MIIEYQKIANLIDDNTLNQPSKFRTRNWIEINDESRGAYNVNSQIKFKTTMLKSSLRDYSDTYILFKGTITVNNTAAQGAAANNTNKKVIFKNCAPFLCKTTGSLWQYCKDIPARDNNNLIERFTAANLTDLFNFKTKITGRTGNGGTKDVEIMVPLKYLSNFWRTLEMLHVLIMSRTRFRVNPHSIVA